MYYPISSPTSTELVFSASNGATAKVKAVYLENENYVGGEINSKVSINAKDEYVSVGEQYNLGISVVNLDPQNTQNLNLTIRNFSLTSADTTIATVSTYGVVTGKGVGETSIVAYNSTYGISFAMKFRVVENEAKKQEYSQTLNNNMILYSSFDSSLKDEVSGTSYTVNSDIKNSTEKVKYGSGSAYFSGQASQRLLINKSNLNFGTNDFTVEFWAYPLQQTMQYPVAFGNDAYTGFAFYLSDPTSNSMMSLYAKNTIKMVSTEKGYTQNQWNKYTILRCEGVFYLLENDNILSVTAEYKTMPVDLRTLAIGGNNSTTNTAFKGYIDDFTIYNAAIIKNDQITELYDLNITSKELNVGESVDVDIIGDNKIRLYKADKVIEQGQWTWKSINEDIATVDSNGLITAKSVGTTTIVARRGINAKRIVVKVSGEGNMAQPKIVGGYKYFAALKSDGTLWTWGDNTYGQLGTGDQLGVIKPKQVTSVTGIIDVECSYDTTFILKSDGTVWASGSNAEYQLADGTTTSSKVFKKINGLNGIIQISALYKNCYALKSDGTVWSWGYNNNGQLGRTTSAVYVGQVDKASNIVGIFAGGARLIMLDADGSVWGVGLNENGELGNQSTTSVSIPVNTIIGGGRVKEVASGEFHTVFLMEDGKVYTVGDNTYGQLGTGNTTKSIIPINISTVSAVKHVYVRGYSTYLTRNKSIAGNNQGMYVAGKNANGVLFNSSISNIKTFTNVQTDKDIIFVGVSNHYSYTNNVTAAIVDSNGRVYTVGYNVDYEMGDGTNVTKSIPTLIGKSKLIIEDKIINLEKINDIAQIKYNVEQEFNLLYDTTAINNCTNISLDTNVATVDSNGIITGKAIGSTIIVAYSPQYNSYSSVRVKVNGEGNVAQPKIVGGNNHYIALKANGTAWAWGLNNYGQIGNGTTINIYEPQQVTIPMVNENGETIQQPISDIIDVACGDSTTYILRNDGTVWSSGYNNYGQLGIGNTTNFSSFKQVSGLNNIIEISAGSYSGYALKSDGTVWGWGRNNYGQLGDATSSNRYAPVQMKNVSNAIQIATNGSNVFVLETSGNVKVTGNNSSGQLGINSTSTVYTPVDMYDTDGTTILSNVNEIAAGSGHVVILTNPGLVYTCGNNNYGQLGTGDTTSSSVLKQMIGITQAKHLYAGKNNNVYITAKDNGVYVCGYNGNGQLFTKNKDNVLTPIKVLADKNIISVGTTNTATSIVDEIGDIYSVGQGNYGTVKINEEFSTLEKYRTTEYNVENNPKTITMIKAGDTEQLNPYINVGLNLVKNPEIEPNYDYETLDINVATVTPEGLVVAQGIGSTLVKIYNAQINSYETVKVNVLGEGNVAQPKIVAGNNHFAALKSNGTVWTWGNNSNGQLGLGNNTNMSTPQQTNIIDAIDVACSGNTTYVLKADGTVWGAGYNGDGQLADNTTTSSNVFKKIDGLEEITQISAHNINCYALKSNGTVWSWGNNSNGQLGSTGTSLPGQMKYVSDIAQIAAGNNFLIMLDSDGCIWGVGNNFYGQIGNGTTTGTSVPAKTYNELGRIKEIAVGGYHTVMLLENGEVYQCGYNGYGQLGNNSTTNSKTPIKVEGIENVKHIYATENETYISTTTNGMYIIGNNNNAQLYTGDKINVKVPKKVQTDKDIYMITGTVGGTAAIVNESGYIYTIGYSGYGEIGDGLTSSSIEPVDISNSMIEVDKTRIILNLESENSSHSISAATKIGFNLKTDLYEDEIIQYTSLNTDIATVTPDGIITAQKFGQTEIEAISDKSGLKTLISVEVINKNDVATPKIVNGADYTIALKSDGTVWSYGSNLNGQLGLGDTNDRYKPTKVNISNIIDIAVGGKHALLLSKSGKVYSFGLNGNGQLGRIGQSNIPMEISNLEEIVKIQAGEKSSMAIDKFGNIYVWGANNYGQLGNGKTVDSSLPQKIRSYGITKIGMGGNSTAGIDVEGNLYTWGENSYGQLGIATKQVVYSPTRILNMQNIQDIKVGKYNIVALDRNGNVWTSGAANNLGNESTQDSTTFGKVVSETDSTQDLENIEKVRVSDDSVIAVKSDETAVAWGTNTNQQLATLTPGVIKTPYILKIAPEKNIVQEILDITAGNGTVSFANVDGEVWTNGKNDHGQLGNKTITNATEFQCISGINIQFAKSSIMLNGINDVTTIQANVVQEFNLVKEDAQSYNLKYTSMNPEIATVTENTGIVTAVAKGKTQIIVQDTLSGKENSVPVFVMGENDITIPQIESNSFSNIALKSNGEVWSYGSNAYGELGTGDASNKNVPTYTGINNIMQVALGTTHCVAVDIEGHVWTWGDNSNGQLGVGAGVESSYIKVEVKSPDGQGVLENIIAVAAGDKFSMALDRNGHVYTWGSNNYGQLGLNNKIDSNLPVKVQGLENIINIHAKNSSSFVIDSNNNLWSCGYNGYGNLGLNNYVNQLVFVQVSTIENVAEVKASETNTTYVTTTDGTVYGFGNSANKSLLNATGGIVPQSLSALSSKLQGISKIAAGYCTGYAITSQANVLGWGLNNYTQLSNGDTITQSEPVYLKDVNGNNFEGAMLVSANNGSIQVAKSDGTIWSAGNNDCGQLGDSTNVNKAALEQIAIDYIKVNQNEVVLKLSNPVHDMNARVEYGFNLLYEIKENEQLLYTSSDDSIASVNEEGSITAHKLGRTYITIKSADSKYFKRVMVDVIGEEKVTKEKAIAGNGTTITLKQDGTVWACGVNSYGQMGNGRANSQLIEEPTRIEKSKYIQTTTIVNEDETTMVTTAEVDQEFKNIVDIAAGEVHNLAVDTNGTVWAWGYNGYGSLGDGTTNNHYVPFRIENFNNIKKVQIDGNTSYALSADGDIYAWGYGYTNMPEKILFGKKVQQITNKILLCEDGSIYTLEKQPRAVKGFNKIVAIASNGNNYAGLDVDGKVWTLGNNSYGQLGTEDTVAYTTPVQVKIDTPVKEVQYGIDMLELLDVDGNVYTCGTNVSFVQDWRGLRNGDDWGKLGTGTTTHYDINVKKAETVKNIKTISSGYMNTIATDKNGVVYTTGDNRYKQLGDKTQDGYRLEFQPIKNKYINVDAKNIILGLNETKQVKATLNNKLNLITDVVDANNIEYTSLDESIVAVTANGLVLGRQVGTAEVVVTHTITGESAVIFVKVNPNEGIAVPKVVQGTNHTIALKADGTVWAWGDNIYGQLGIGSTETQISPIKVPTMENVIDIAAGPYYTLCLKADGTVWSWGYNRYGSLGNGTNQTSLIPVQVITNENIPLNKIVKITANKYKSVALDENGRVWNWGYEKTLNAKRNPELEGIIDISVNYVVNTKGEVIKIDDNTKVDVSNIVRVSEGIGHVLFLSKSGTGYAYGDNTYGQLGTGNTASTSIPKLISDSTGRTTLTGIKQLIASENNSIALINTNETYIWGSYADYKLCSDQTTNQVLPKKLNNIEPAIGCFIGDNNAGIIDLKGFVYTWGLGDYGNLGNKSYGSSSVPVLVGKKELDLNANDVTLHSNETYQLTATNGTFNVLKQIVENMQVEYTSGNPNIALVSESGEITAANTGKTTILVSKVGTEYKSIVNVTVLPDDVNIEPMVVTEDSHTIVLKADGTVWAYGDNSNYVLGNRTSNSSDKPVKVNFPGENIVIKQIATGNKHVLAVDTNGDVWGWGNDSNYALGFTSNIPVKMNLKNIKKVIAKNDQSMAITNDGFAYVWGYNVNGELGLGTYQAVKTPTVVSYLNEIIDGDLGTNHSILLTKSGKVLTTGLNVYGQTGKAYGKSNKFEEISVPEVITKVVAGDNHSILLSYDSNVYALGNNNRGQLANGTTENLFAPTQVFGGIMDISVGKEYTMVLTQSKELYAAGSNSNGELGVGKGDRKSFTKVENINDILSFDCGTTYSTAITYDGNVYGWGDYYHGLQKIKTLTNSTIPVKLTNDFCYTQTPEIILNINSTEQIQMVDNYVFNVFMESDITSNYTYESLNETIATVSNSGEVEGISAGTTWIRVTEQGTNKVSIVMIKVIEEGFKTSPIVSGGEEYTVVLKASGDIWSYGCNDNGQLGLDNLIAKNIPNQINILTSYTKVASGKKFSVALRDDGTVWAWGDNTYGQLGQGNRISAQKPIQVQYLDSIIDIAVGNNHVLALDTAGNIYAWGLNSSGQLGTGDNLTVSLPTKVIGISNKILDITAGGNTTAVVDSTGSVYVFGSNENEKIAQFSYNYDKYGQKILPAVNEYFVKAQKIYGVDNAVKVQCVDDGLLVLDSNEQVDKITKYGSQSILNVTTVASEMVDLEAKGKNIMLLDEAGKVYSYGDNSFGQAGIGLVSSLVELSQPTMETPTTVEKYIAVGCGDRNNYVIDEKGYVYSAGSNEFGQIGNGTYEDSSKFTITSDTNFDVMPEIKIMEQPETETLNIGGSLFNVYNNDTSGELENYTYESSNSEIVSVQDGILTAQNTGEATITITNKLTGATKSILRVVQPLDEDRINTMEMNGTPAELTGVKTYKVDVVPDENGIGTLVITTKNETDTITIGESAGVGTLTKEILLDTETKEIQITVTASNGNSVQYTLNVKVLSQDATLQTIKIGEIEATAIGPESYEIVIDNTISKPEVTAIATSTKAKIIIESGLAENTQSTKLINMTGKIKKVIPVIVVAESGDEKVYELSIYKEEALTALSSLKVNGINAMKMDENTYITTIKNEIETAKIDATTIYQTAQININEDQPQIYVTTKTIATTEDETIVKIYVSAKNINREITLTITKEKELSNLNILKVTANTVELTQMGGIYTAQVMPDVISVELEVTTQDETDLVSIGDSESTAHIATKIVNVPVGEEATVTVTVTDLADVTNTKQYKINIKRPNSDTTLKLVSVQNAEITKQAIFENGTNNYKVEVSEKYAKINVSAIANCDLSKVSINGSDFESDSEEIEVELIENPTEVLIQVAAADESIQEYKLYITRQSMDASLNKITVDGNEATISENYDGEYEGTYEYILAESKDTLTIEAIANNENAYIRIDTNDKEKVATTKQVSMVGGTINVIVEITAEDGTVKQYKLIVHSLSNNTGIRTVRLNTNKLDSIPTNRYVGRINRNDETFELYIAADDENSKIKVNDNEPVVGNVNLTIAKTQSTEIVNITVISESGLEELYTVEVTNQSDNCDILSIKVNNEDAQINEQGKYIIGVPGITQNIDVQVMAVSELAQIEINNIVSNNANVTIPSIENIVNIKITAEDGTSKNYELIVSKVSNEVGANIYVVYANEPVEGGEVTEDLHPIVIDENGKGIIRINESDETLIRVVTTDEKAKIEISGSEATVATKDTVVSTTTQITTLPIRIIATDGTIKQYEIELVRNSAENQLLDLAIEGVEDTDIIKTSDNVYTALIPDTMTIAKITALGSDLTKIQINENEYSTNNSITSEIPVNSEQQIVTINVKSESGAINTYELKLIKVTDLRLSSVKIDDTEAIIEDNIYKGFIESTVESVSVKILPANLTALVSVKQGNGEYTQISEENGYTIQVPITANPKVVYIKVQDPVDTSRIKEYILSIEQKSSNSEIYNIEVNGNNVLREEDTFNWELPMSEQNIEVVVTAVNQYAAIQLGTGDSQIGVNETNVDLGTEKTVTIPITITSQDGTSISTYNLVIYRKSEDTSCEILVDSVQPDETAVNPETNEKTYIKYITNDVTSVVVKVTANDDLAIVEAIGESETKTLSTTITTTESETELLIDVIAENGNKETYKVLIVKNSSDSTLESVKVDNYLVSKNDSGTYVANVVEDGTAEQTIDIEAVTTNSRAKVKIDTDEFTQNIVTSTKPLSNEAKTTTFTITVQPQDVSASSEMFTLQVNKISINNKVKSVKTGDTEIVDYDSESHTYNYYVGNDITELPITIETENEYASITYGEDAGTNILDIASVNIGTDAEKTITFKVTSESGAIQEYNVRISRYSDNATISKLYIDDVDVTSQIIANNVIKLIEKDTTNSIIRVVSTDKNATIKIGDNEPGIGDITRTAQIETIEKTLIVPINITAQDGTTQEQYNVILNRKSDNTLIDTLQVDGETLIPLVDGNYETTVKYSKTSAAINVKTEYGLASVTLGGETNISQISTNIMLNKNTDTVRDIVVTAQDGTTKTYTLTIHKTPDELAIKSISVNGVLVTEVDTDGTYKITTPLGTTEAVIEATTIVETSKIKISDSEFTIGTAQKVKQLLEDYTKVNIVVENSEGGQSTYTLIIQKAEATLSSDTTCEILINNEQPEERDEEHGIYTKYVNRADDKATIKITTTNENAKVIIGEEQAPHTMESIVTITGEVTEQQIIIESERGIQKTYTIKLAKKSTNADIDAVIVNGKVLEQDENGVYKIDILSNAQLIQNVPIQITTVDPYASVRISTSSKWYQNILETSVIMDDVTRSIELNIFVQAQDPGEAPIMKVLKINRLSDDSGIKSVKVNNEFCDEYDATTKTYTKFVDRDLSEALVEVATTDEMAEVTIGDRRGLSYLLQNIQDEISETPIKVTTQTGKEEIYILKIVKKSSNNNLEEIRVNDQVVVPDIEGKYVIDILDDNTTSQYVSIKAKTEEVHAQVQIGDGTQWYTNIGVGNTRFIGATRKITMNINVCSHEGQTITKVLEINRFSIDTGIKSVKVNNELVTEYIGSTHTFKAKIKSNVQNISIVLEANNIYTKIVADEQENMAIATLGTINVEELKTVTKTFKLVAENGAEQEYTLIVEKMSENCNLQHLYLNGEDIIQKFIDVESVPTAYVSIQKLEQIMKIEAQAENAYARIHIGDTVEGFGDILRTLELDLSVNTIIVPIVVTSQDGIYVKTYNIIFTRLPNNTKITALKVDGKTITPDNDGNYEAYIRASRNETEINIALEDRRADIEMDSKLSVGQLIKTIPIGSVEQTVKQIKIIAQDGTERIVTLTINKSINDLDLSKVYVDNRAAKQLSYNTYQIDVAQGTTSVNIRAIAEKSTEYVSIKDNTRTIGENIYLDYQLDGTTVKINVVALDNEGIIDEQCEYSLILNEIDENETLEDLIPEIKVDNVVIEQKEDGKYYAVVSVDADNAIVYVGSNSETTDVKLTAGVIDTEYTFPSVEKNIGLAEDVTNVIVKAKNGAGTEKEYTLCIIKETEQNISTGLEYLKYNGNVIVPNENGLYEIVIGMSDTTVDLEAKAISQFSAIEITENNVILSQPVIDGNGLPIRNMSTAAVDMQDVTEKLVLVTVKTITGKEKTYIINISKQEELKLKSLTVNTRIATQVSETDYTIDVLKGTTNIDIKGILYNNLEYVKIAENTPTQGENTNLQYNLSNGKIITIIASSSLNSSDPDYQEKTYTLTITEVETVSELSDLQLTITVNGNIIDPTDDGIYIAQVDTELEKAQVRALASSYSTRVKIGDSEYTTRFAEASIDLTSKEVEIIVIGENTDNQSVQKELWIVKQFSETEDAGLKELKVNNSIITPQPDGTYLIRISRFETEVLLEATSIQKLAFVSINGNMPLRGSNNNVIDLSGININTSKITIESVSGVIKEYTVVIDQNKYITGKITTDSVNQNAQNAKIIVYNSADARIENDPVAPREVVLENSINGDGTYLVKLLPGKYDFVIRKTSYLEYRITGIEVEDAKDIELSEIRLYAGDIGESGEIELSDLTKFNEYFMNLKEEKNRLHDEIIKYDLDENGVVNIADRNILKENYGRRATIIQWKKPQQFILPMLTDYTITSEYGIRTDPLTGQEGSMHTGIDISGLWHTEIYAVADGEVTYAGVQEGYGNCIEIKHIIDGQTIYSFYAHLSQIDVQLGDLVIQAQKIGLEGGAATDPNPGDSTGHHLHFEIRDSLKQHIDPTTYITF